MVTLSERKLILLSAGHTELQADSLNQLIGDNRQETIQKMIKGLQAVPDSERLKSASYIREKLGDYLRSFI